MNKQLDLRQCYRPMPAILTVLFACFAFGLSGLVVTDRFMLWFQATVVS